MTQDEAFTAPKARCTGLLGRLLGHKYEARYDSGASQMGIEQVRGSFSHLAALADRYREKTYVRDVCARCGSTVEKPYSPK